MSTKKIGKYDNDPILNNSVVTHGMNKSKGYYISDELEKRAIDIALFLAPKRVPCHGCPNMPTPNDSYCESVIDYCKEASFFEGAMWMLSFLMGEKTMRTDYIENIIQSRTCQPNDP